MNAYLVSYHSLREGWIVAVVEAAGRDQAVTYAVNEYGPSGTTVAINCQQLTGLPLVRRHRGRTQVHTVAQVAA